MSALRRCFTTGVLDLKIGRWQPCDRLAAGEKLAARHEKSLRDGYQRAQYVPRVQTSRKSYDNFFNTTGFQVAEIEKAVPREMWPWVKRIVIDDVFIPEGMGREERYLAKCLICWGLDYVCDMIMGEKK